MPSCGPNIRESLAKIGKYHQEATELLMGTSRLPFGSASQ